MNSKDNSPTKPKSPSEHTKLSRLNDLCEPSLKNLEGTTRLEGKYKGSETSKSTESKYPENTFNDIPKHDALIRKAFEGSVQISV